MATTPTTRPHPAASAIFRFGGEVFFAAALQRVVFETAARDPTTWRKAAGVVILAAAAADSLGVYSEVDLFLVRVLVNWSLIPLMLLAIARLSVGTAAALAVARILGEGISYGALWRSSGYAYAPAIVQIIPALIYWLDLLPVTQTMVWTLRWLALPWTIAALTVAAGAAGVSTVGRATVVAAVLFVGANLFDVLLDLLLFIASGLVAHPSTPSDAVL